MSSPLICAVDDSPRAFEAVAVARDLASRTDLRLMLAHVADEPLAFPFGEAQQIDEERARHRARAYELLRKLAATADLPADADLRAETGDAPVVLCALADEERAAGVVVASRGHGRVRAAVFGSLTRALVGELACPVFIVPAGAAAAYRWAGANLGATVLCALETTEGAEEVVRVADRLALDLDARLQIVHVEPPVPVLGMAAVGAPLPPPPAAEPQHDRERAVGEWAQAIGCHSDEVELLAETGDLVNVLGDLAEREEVQLVVVSREAPWHRLAARSPRPVVVVPG